MAEQVKALKLMHERGKDENESLMKTLRDLQAEGFDNQKMTKMYYVVMLSRWHEAAVNKKYEAKLNECNQLVRDTMLLQEDLDNRQNDFIDSEQEVQRLRVENKGLRK